MLPGDEAQDRAELTQALSELSRVVISEQSLGDLLRQVVFLARSTVHGADGASVSLTHDRGAFTSNSTDEVFRDLDDIQYAHWEGPCVDAINQGHQVAVAMERVTDRYPEFAPIALERFISGMLSTPFVIKEQPFGALNLYSSTVSSWEDSERRVAALFADQAAALLANAAAYATSTETAENLERALENRDVIGQAKGILMGKRGISSEEAFDVLRAESQRTNRKLVDVARDVAAKRGAIGADVDPLPDPRGS